MRHDPFCATYCKIADATVFIIIACPPSGDITEDVELIEGLEETKRIATDIGQRSALAKDTQVDAHGCLHR